MALKDLLNEVKKEEAPKPQPQQEIQIRELTELLKQTQELNTIMKGYITTHMDKQTVAKMTIDSELLQIRETSQKVQQGMSSTLQQQEKLLEVSKQSLIKVLQTGQTEMRQNNAQTVQQLKSINHTVDQHLKEIQTRIDQDFKKIRSNMENEIKSISQESQNAFSHLETKSRSMIWNVRKEIFINDWLDVAKYGAGTAVFVVPFYIGVKSLLGLVGIDIP